MKSLWSSHTALTVRRVALLYAVLALCRLLFFWYNRPLIGPVEAWWPLIKGSLQFDTVSILYAEGLWLVLALLPLPLALRESRLWQRLLYGLYAVVGSLIVALNLSDAVYFRYTQKRFTADEIFFADNSNSLQLMGKFMAENWYLVAAWVVLTLLLVGGAKAKSEPRSPIRKGWGYYPASTLVLLLTLGLAVGGIRGGFTRMTRPITLSNATLYAPSSAQANLILSNPFCILRTAGSSSKVEIPNYLSKAEAEALYTPYHYPTSDTQPALLEGRNVVLFILESMSAEHSAELHPELYADSEQAGFTPFLDSLMRSGYCFRAMHANGLRSIQAMPAILGSIPSFKTPFVLMPQALGESRPLPRMLRDRGYETAFFCGSEAGSMGFGAYARSAGVEHLYAREEYEARHGKGDFDGYWGIWDDKFLQFLGEELSTFKSPFFATLFTLSSHHPFVVPDHLKDSLPAGHTPIHRCAAYEDWAFSEFFKRFRDEPWFNNTLFVFVADHVSSERYGEQSRQWPGDHHIMGFLYAPQSGLQGESTEPAQQIDLMPTILGLLGNREPYFAFGRDLFGEAERTPWAFSYENGYQLLTESGARELSPEMSEEDDEARKLKALIQQYYEHIAQKSYIVK